MCVLCCPHVTATLPASPREQHSGCARGLSAISPKAMDVGLFLLKSWRMSPSSGVNTCKMHLSTSRVTLPCLSSSVLPDFTAPAFKSYFSCLSFCCKALFFNHLYIISFKMHPSIHKTAPSNVQTSTTRSISLGNVLYRVRGKGKTTHTHDQYFLK